jgi:peptide/nickel transport system permease protein
VRRLLGALLVLALAVTLTFAMTVALPADPARALVGPHADDETIARVRHEYCFDRPVWVTYGCYVGRLARGDLGTSFRNRRPVVDVLLEHTVPTLELSAGALALMLLGGVSLGVAAAARRGGLADRATDVFAAVGQSAPAFVVGPFLIGALAYGAGLFPVSGRGGAGLDRLWHLFLPSLTLALAGAAAYARLLRAELGEALREDYVRTARAKGLSPRAVLWRHALRNAVVPLVALAGVDAAGLLGGAVVTETVFAWPGLGREAVLAVLNVDLPVALGVVLVSAALVLVVGLLADLAVAALDPRVVWR